MPLVVAQCANSKVPGTVVAMDKYRTRVHNTIREFMFDGGYAAGWDWSILSAKHGLVHPTRALDDYDMILEDVTRFVAELGEQIRAEVESNDAADKILFVGSKLYCKALRQALPGRKIQHIGEGGRGCGDYFSALQAGFAMYDEDA